MRRNLILLALTALTPALATAAPAGRVTSGWPILSVGADALHVGGDGGPVVIDWSGEPSLIGAYTPTGATRWGRIAYWSCGNCPGFFHNTAPGAPYGQIGPFSSLYSNTGAKVVGTRTFGVGAKASSDTTTVVWRTLPGQSTPTWQTTLPAPFSDRYLSGDPQLFVTGSTVFITPNEDVTPGNADTLFALDLTTGAIRWERPDTLVVAVVDSNGVLVRGQTGSWQILNVDGTVRTTLAVPDGDVFAAVSAAHNRVYFRNSTNTRVTALDATTGQVAWSSPSALKALA